VNSSSGYYTIKHKLLKGYNTQVQVSTWDVHVSLLNHVKNKFINSFFLFFYFNHFNYIIGYYIHDIYNPNPLLDIIIIIIIEQ